MYAELCRLIVDDYEVGGPSVEVLAGYEDRSFGEAIGLRLLGAVHGLVLAGEVPELAAFYPSVGGVVGSGAGVGGVRSGPGVTVRGSCGRC